MALALFLSSFALQAPARLHRVDGGHQTPARTALVRMKVQPPQVELIDEEGDPIRFQLTEAGDLQMFDRGELLCDKVERLDFGLSEGLVTVQPAEVEFNVVYREQQARLTAWPIGHN